jgi:hypothetical protein
MVRAHQPGEAAFGSVLPEDVTQVTAIGPLGLEYLDQKDDPRNRSV